MICIDFIKFVDYMKEKIKQFNEDGMWNAARDYSHILEFMLSQPTIEAEKVVRCKDCVGKNQNGNLEPFVCTRNNILVYDNCYCSFGIKRSDTQ